MRALLTIGGLAVAIAFGAHGAAAETISVMLDQARVMRTDETAATIIIGNPSIADATVRDANTLVLTGRSHGTTNLILLDEDGELISDTQILVEGPSPDRVTMYRGEDRYSYTCGERCDPVLAPGDEALYYDIVAAQAKTRTDAANGQAESAPLAAAPLQ